MKSNVVGVAVILGIGFFAGCSGGDGGGEGPIVPPPPAPAEYADKHMPPDWWTDSQKLEEGRKLFIGEGANPDVNCASCHGKDGKPVKAGATDFRNPERMKLYSDSVWFWRISEGVPNSKMRGWKSKLSDEDRWRLVLFERSFSMPGKIWNQEKKEWLDAGASAGGAANSK